MELLPAFPVALGQAVFDADDWEFVDKGSQPVDHLATGQVLALTLQLIAAIMVELTRGSIHRKDDICANGIASIGNRFAQQGEWLAVALADAWCIATFITNSGGVVVCFEDFGKSVEDFGAHAERVCKSCCTFADDHKLLDIGRKGGVRTTVENIHHW